MIDLAFSKTLAESTQDLILEARLSLEQGSFTAIYGPSGAGKTTVLRIIAGLVTPDTGTIIVDGTPWFDTYQKRNIPPQLREVGFVFQESALFPNMTVEENLNYARSKSQNAKWVQDLMDLTEIASLKNRKPDTLSGGQKQRVSLARTLVRKPRLLLLDEPFSALDDEAKQGLQRMLHTLHKEMKLTTILVSHDMAEIMQMADRVIKLDHGKVVADGQPQKIFLQQGVSSKFVVTGTIVNIEANDITSIVTVAVQSNLVQVVIRSKESNQWQLGDRVMVASKAFNPILLKAHTAD